MIICALGVVTVRKVEVHKIVCCIWDVSCINQDAILPILLFLDFMVRALVLLMPIYSCHILELYCFRLSKHHSQVTALMCGTCMVLYNDDCYFVCLVSYSCH